jgi:hypothetical protein
MVMSGCVGYGVNEWAAVQQRLNPIPNGGIVAFTGQDSADVSGIPCAAYGSRGGGQGLGVVRAWVSPVLFRFKNAFCVHSKNAK